MSDSTTPQDLAAMSPASTGSVGEPVAWVVGGPGGPRVFLSRDEARKYMHDTLSMDLVCLYKHQPMRLTDAERAAIQWAAEAARDRASVWTTGDQIGLGVGMTAAEHADTLRGLKERMG